MSKRYKGAILSSTPPTTSTSSASGVWTEQQFMQGVATGNWPALAGAPTIGTATAGALSASVTFTAPTYTGSGITGYTVTSNPGGITGTGASSPVTVSGLTAGTAYTFTVTATTAAGQGPASAASNSVTPTAPNYIEDVFSTWLYDGTGTAQTINNGVNLSGNGGMIWIKCRSNVYNNEITDTIRGTEQVLNTNTTDASYLYSGTVTAFNSNGFSIGTNTVVNANFNTFASWTFRKQPKFFDVVTWTGDANPTRTIAHNLGSVPGCIIVKETGGVRDWVVYHTSIGNTKYLTLNNTSSALTQSFWNNTSPTSTVFSVNGDWNAVNGPGRTYVAYLFASNAGGFGLTGTDNVISCGSFTCDGSGDATVTLGYEPQWILRKASNEITNWELFDNMRGLSVTDNETKLLYPNLSNAEESTSKAKPTATGFIAKGEISKTYIYIAIRRGPMKVPTSGTSVFGITTAVGTSPMYQSSFPVDVALRKQITGGDPTLQSRLTGATNMFTDYNFAEGSDANVTWYYQNGMFTSTGANANQYGYLIRRAPSYMDVVCYTGDSTTPRNITHNLGAAPELMIVKCRSNARGWAVYSSGIGAGKYVILNATNASLTDTTIWANTAPTSSVFTVGNPFDVNNSGYTYIAYLFATCAGVSKVGSYTGTGALQTINCGFTGGARFVLIKRTDSTGDWYVYDTSNGMTSGNDPYWLINDAAAQVTGTNYVDTDSTGFKVTAAAPAGLNASGGTYIFLAIA